MGEKFDFRVSLQVRHPALSAAEIAEAVGIEAKPHWSVGEPRKTPKGTLLGGERQESYCSFEIAAGDDGELAKFLGGALLKLKPRRDALLKLRNTGGSLMFYVFWYSHGDTGEEFTVALLKELADMGIGLGINVYDERSAD